MPQNSSSTQTAKGRTSRVIAFDIYGTVIDPQGMSEHLKKAFGEQAREATRLWREKQVEFSFRRALMRKYVNFDVCTAQALDYVSARLGVNLGDDDKRALLSLYLRLPAFSDVKTAFESLKHDGYMLVALTNGTEKSVRILLEQAGLIQYLEAIISTDTIQTFKPNPAVYEHLVRSVKRPKDNVWLVSSNAWDVIGAKAYGLKTAWLRRDPASIFDPWEFSPDLMIDSLEKLRDGLHQQEMT